MAADFSIFQDGFMDTNKFILHTNESMFVSEAVGIRCRWSMFSLSLEYSMTSMAVPRKDNKLIAEVCRNNNKAWFCCCWSKHVVCMHTCTWMCWYSMLCNVNKNSLPLVNNCNTCPFSCNDFVTYHFLSYRSFRNNYRLRSKLEEIHISDLLKSL